MSRKEKDDSPTGSSSDVEKSIAKSLLENLVGLFDSKKTVANTAVTRKSKAERQRTMQNNVDHRRSNKLLTPKTVRGDDPNEPWWNEYPLEGDPNRPAVIFANLLSKSPRLIGWDDEKWERQAMEIIEKNRERDRLRPPDELPSEGDTQLVENEKGEIDIHVSFGFIERVSDIVADRIEQFDKASDKEQTNIMNKGDSKLGDKGVARDSSFKHDSRLENEDDAIRDSDLYQAALSALRWQRDAYLVGPAFANQRKIQRNDNRKSPTEVQPTPQEINWNDLSSLIIEPKTYKTIIRSSTDLPYDASALGNIQLARLGEWFIPSRTVQKALLPIVLGLPQGPLYQPAYNVLTNLIPMSQPTLDRALKNTVIWFLQDEQWRHVIKNSMNGYIATTYRDSSSPKRS